MNSARLAFWGLLALAPTVAFKVSAGVYGPYIDQYSDVATWSRTDDCGTWTKTVTRYVWVDGAMFEQIREVQNDCYNLRYGNTDITIEQYLEPEGDWYKLRYGLAGGQEVYEFYSELDPDFGVGWPEWIVCNVTHDFGDGLTYQRTARATVTVRPSEPTGTKPNQLIGLVGDVTKWDWDDSQAWWIPVSEIPYNQITVAGTTLDCNYSARFLIWNGVGSIEVTPSVNPAVPYYTFGLFPVYPIQVIRTNAHHPQLSSPPSAQTLQDDFNAASLDKFAYDSDGCIPDDSPTLYDSQGSPTATSRADDVPFLAEFYIFPSASETFPPPFDAEEFLYIANPADESALLYATFSHIKIVASLPNNAIGVALYDDDRIIFKKSYGSTVLLHEWGHNVGLMHRGDWANPDSNLTYQEDNTTDYPAVMYYQNWEGGEVNRHEKGNYLDYGH